MGKGTYSLVKTLNLMKNIKIRSHHWFVALALLAFSMLNSPLSTAHAQGTAFTYQGQLQNNGSPANGSYDLTLALFNASTGGSQTGSTLTNAAVGVTNGLFIVTADFGTVFNGTAYWLQIGVCTNGGSTFTPLNPRQELTPTPYSVTAENVTGVVPLAQLPPTVSLLSDPGADNFFAGSAAGNPSVAGGGDVGVGGSALAIVSSGSYNTAEGFDALQDDSTGSYNSGFGAYALQWVTTGSYNTASGVFALSSEPSYVTGSGNTADGALSLYSVSSGSDNVAIGYGTMYSASVDSGVVAVGYQALQNDVGAGGFLSIGSGNNAVGYQALQADTIGADNTAIGYQSMNKNTNGYNNSAVGTWTLLSNLSGYNNTASGAYAMLANTTGYQNTAAGSSALGGNLSGYDNVAIGDGALQSSTDDNGAVAIGYEALQNDSTTGGFLSIGSGNTGIGYQSLQANTGGSDNTGIGYQSLSLNNEGYNNLAVGVLALYSNNGGDNNTALGTYALDSMTSGSGNIAVGEGAGSSLTSGNNNIYIGSSGAANDNNVIRIGNGDSQIFLTGAVQGNTGINDINVDPNGLNIGNVNSNAVTFGISSGEGICSKRANAAANKYDLELWTDFNERLKVAQGGNVGINTDNPQQQLEVNGNYALVDGGGAYNGDGSIDAYIGGNGSGSDVQIGSMNSSITAVGFWNTASSAYMHIYCSSITIEGGSDLAEPFPITKAEQPVSEGEVVVIDDANPGQLKLTDQPYDTRVAGVISGANGIHPGIQMQQQGLLEGGKNVALTGRVYVQADTSNGAIKPGDLLTTSCTPGRAMRVSDHSRAQGAILGKAMTALKTGHGMVLVLVTLQ